MRFDIQTFVDGNIPMSGLETTVFFGAFFAVVIIGLFGSGWIFDKIGWPYSAKDIADIVERTTHRIESKDNSKRFVWHTNGQLFVTDQHTGEEFSFSEIVPTCEWALNKLNELDGGEE